MILNLEKGVTLNSWHLLTANIRTNGGEWKRLIAEVKGDVSMKNIANAAAILLEGAVELADVNVRPFSNVPAAPDSMALANWTIGDRDA